MLWRFSSGYESNNKTHEPTPIPLLFIVLPILYHEETFLFIKSTYPSSGLRAFAGKFSSSSNAKSDLLLSIHSRAQQMKLLTLESMSLCFSSNLLMMLSERGCVTPLSLTSPRLGIPKSVRDMCKQSDKLGAWCANLSLHEISVILKVGL